MMLRRVEAYVEIEGEERLMVFITNNLAWSPRTACDLYKQRWDSIGANTICGALNQAW